MCISNRKVHLSTSNDAGSRGRNGVNAVWVLDDGWSRKQWVLGVAAGWIRFTLKPECPLDAGSWGLERWIRFIRSMNSTF